MERSSQVPTTTWKSKNLIFSFKFWWHATDIMSPKWIAALIFLDRNMLTAAYLTVSVFMPSYLYAIFSFYNVCIDKFT